MFQKQFVIATFIQIFKYRNLMAMKEKNMQGWKLVHFSDTPTESVRNGIYKPKKYHGVGTKIVNMGELFSNNRLSDMEMKRLYITDKEKEKYSLRNGDLIFARRSLTAEGAGKCSLVYNVSDDIVFESSIIRARPDKNKASSQFLFYFFSSPYGKYLIGTILRQVAVAGITGSDLMKLEFMLPPLAEQKAIAAVLSSLDDKIDLLHRQNATLERMAETLFRQWFIEEAEEGWDIKPLTYIANFLNGLACQKFPPQNDIDKLPVLKIRELNNGISEDSDFASSCVGQEYIIHAGDVIFSWSGSLLVKIWHGEDCILNQHLFKVYSSSFPKWFYYFWCKHHLLEFSLIAESHATTMGHIKRRDLEDAEVLVPDRGTLENMTKVIAPLFEKLLANTKQIRTLEKLRDTLLPKLMSGEVRVRVAE